MCSLADIEPDSHSLAPRDYTVASFMQALFTFVSRGGWVWLAGGGARKLRHSLTRMKLRTQNVRFPWSLRSKFQSLSSFACFSARAPNFCLSVTSSPYSPWTEVAAPPPPSGRQYSECIGIPSSPMTLDQWLVRSSHLLTSPWGSETWRLIPDQCQSSFDYCWRRSGRSL